MADDSYEQYLNELLAIEALSVQDENRDALLEQIKQNRESAPPIFKPFFDPWRYKAAHGGRGGAKSHFFAGELVNQCVEVPGTRAVCLREVQRTLRESVKILIEDKIRKSGWEDMFEIRYDFIRTPGNGLIIFQGMTDHTADSIKSLEGFRIAYFEEAQTMTQRSLELLRPTIRSPGSEIWFAWNPRHQTDPVDEFFRSATPPENAKVIEVGWRDNPYFPKELEDERKHDYENNPARYMHIWEGAYEPQAVGALWSRGVINQHRVKEPPILERVLVAVDPATGSEERHDEHGIVIGGLGNDGRGYLLADRSMRGTPEQWGRAVVAEFDFWDADAVVIEVNQGGEMAEHVIKSVRPEIPIRAVHASKGKHVRAEPISALYAIGRISHVGSFPEMEHQMCLITAEGYQGDGSPDRADAMVWLFTSLFGKLTRKQNSHNIRVLPSAPRRLVQRRGRY